MFRYMFWPESVERTAHAPADVVESTTFMVELLPIRLVQREVPIIPRIQGGATMSAWSGVFM